MQRTTASKGKAMPTKRASAQHSPKKACCASSCRTMGTHHKAVAAKKTVSCASKKKVAKKENW